MLVERLIKSGACPRRVMFIPDGLFWGCQPASWTPSSRSLCRRTSWHPTHPWSWESPWSTCPDKTPTQALDMSEDTRHTALIYCRTGGMCVCVCSSTSRWVLVPPWSPCFRGRRHRQLCPGEKTYRNGLAQWTRTLLRVWKYDASCKTVALKLLFLKPVERRHRVAIVWQVDWFVPSLNTPCCPSRLCWIAAPCTHVTRSPCGESQTGTRRPFLTTEPKRLHRPI